jgi:hypothetical protein
VTALHETAARFERIALDELGDAALMRRVDRKFVVPAGCVEALLATCVGAYRVLEVNGMRLSRYATRYFDTPELALYHAHHADRAPRAKVRIREYVDTGQRFVELKRRTNTGRTHKSRVSLNGAAAAALDALRDLPEFPATGLARSDMLGAVLDVDYTRITLVHRTAPERVTVDLNVALSHGARIMRYHGVAFAELKQPRIGPSPFVDALRSVGAREGAISKYCLGVASLVDGAKTNRFKPALARLKHSATTSGLTPCA